VELGQFEASSEQWIENQIGSGGWYLELQTRIANQLSAPEPAPSREMPNFGAMTIGNGYRDLPSEEAEAEEEAPAEEVAEGEVVEEEVAEEEVSGE
jgi:hypothetical protein